MVGQVDIDHPVPAGQVQPGEQRRRDDRQRGGDQQADQRDRHQPLRVELAAVRVGAGPGQQRNGHRGEHAADEQLEDDVGQGVGERVRVIDDAEPEHGDQHDLGQEAGGPADQGGDGHHHTGPDDAAGAGGLHPGDVVNRSPAGRRRRASRRLGGPAACRSVGVPGWSWPVRPDVLGWVCRPGVGGRLLGQQPGGAAGVGCRPGSAGRRGRVGGQGRVAGLVRRAVGSAAVVWSPRTLEAGCLVGLAAQPLDDPQHDHQHQHPAGDQDDDDGQRSVRRRLDGQLNGLPPRACRPDPPAGRRPGTDRSGTPRPGSSPAGTGRPGPPAHRGR